MQVKALCEFEFYTALYHVDIVHAKVYVLDSRFQIPDSRFRIQNLAS